MTTQTVSVFMIALLSLLVCFPSLFQCGGDLTIELICQAYSEANITLWRGMYYYLLGLKWHQQNVLEECNAGY